MYIHCTRWTSLQCGECAYFIYETYNQLLHQKCVLQNLLVISSPIQFLIGILALYSKVTL